MIYADNAATTRIPDRVFEKMLPFLKEQYGNASSQYSLGVNAKRAIEYARVQVAKAICADPSEIVFTSGGSEGNSWVISSFGNVMRNENFHIVTSAIEHKSVLNSCHMLENRRAIVSYVTPDKNGYISPGDVLSAVQPNTEIISIMMANNEVGTVQPIREIRENIIAENILFHTDAVQSIGHIPVDVKELNVDFLTASAHKFNGPKGVGFIYIKKNSFIKPIIFGGEQEIGKRAGTENIAGIVGLGYALEMNISEMIITAQKLSKLVMDTINGLRSAIPNVIINGENTERLPGVVNISFPRVAGESMMHMLDFKGICVSTSSACNAGKNVPSHVLLAMGLTENQAKSTIRISYGKDNTDKDVVEIIKAISTIYVKILKKL